MTGQGSDLAGWALNTALHSWQRCHLQGPLCLGLWRGGPSSSGISRRSHAEDGESLECQHPLQSPLLCCLHPPPPPSHKMAGSLCSEHPQQGEHAPLPTDISDLSWRCSVPIGTKEQRKNISTSAFYLHCCHEGFEVRPLPVTYSMGMS